MQDCRPHSARIRASSSGRSNLSSSQKNELLSQAVPRPRPHTAEYPKTDPGLECPVIRESVFGPSRHPTIPPYEPPKPRRRPKICPDGWEETLNQQNWVDSIEGMPPLNETIKREVSAEIVGRNSYRMWQFDLKYLKKAPSEVFADITDLEDSRFVQKIRSIRRKEKMLDLGGSHNVKACLQDDHLRPVREPKNDPFILTYQTPRDQRIADRQRALGVSTTTYQRKFNRGYRHAPEYHNFSNFNGILKTNKNTILMR